MRNPLILVTLACLTTQVSPVSAQDVAPELTSIRQSELRADLFFLASDAMLGRLTDTPGNRLAAEFIKARFERLGLKPVGTDGSFFQQFDIATASLGADNRLAAGDRSGAELTPVSGGEFYPLRFSGNGTVSGDLVFVSFGIVSPERGHDDYGDERILGKVVMVLAHEPGERDPMSPFDGLITSEESRDVRKAMYAQERGASAVLFVSDVHNHPETEDFAALAANYWPASPRRVPRYLLASRAGRIRIPVVQVSRALAASLLEGSGRTLEQLAQSAERSGGVSPRNVDRRVSLTASVRRQPTSDRNVVAMIEGSDPTVSNELVIISAHYDHDGADGDAIYNGADDDGSGTVALLEIAEAYARAAENGVRPRRSVLFAAWNSEERGLLGAWAYVEDPLFPLEQTVAVLNMDMIGRNEEVPADGGGRFRGLEPQTAESNSNAVNIMGYSYSPDLRGTIEQANADIGLEVKMRYDNNSSNLLRRSDQWPFLQNGVPAVFVHTGLHPDYHTPFDLPERINYVKMEKIARLVYQTSWTLAQSETRPEFRRWAAPIQD